jgi:hypothetical protein
MLEQELRQFTGTENYYRHSLSGTLYTDGIKYLAEKAGAYWLIDAIASYQTATFRERNPFQVWILYRQEGGAVLKAFSDHDRDMSPEDNFLAYGIVCQAIEYSDFPMESIKVYCIDGVILLTSEY